MNPSPTLHPIASSPQVKPRHQRTQTHRRDDHLHTNLDVAEDLPRDFLAILSKHEQQHGRQPGPDEEAEGQEDRFEGEDPGVAAGCGRRRDAVALISGGGGEDGGAEDGVDAETCGGGPGGLGIPREGAKGRFSSVRGVGRLVGLR